MAYRTTKNTKTNPKTGKRVSMWTPAKEKRVYTLYVEEKLGVERVATKMECSPMAVYNLVRDRGWNRKVRNHQAWTMQFLDAHREKVLRKYETMSAAEMSRVGGLSCNGLIEWLKKEGVFVSARERVHKVLAKGLFGKQKIAFRNVQKTLLLDYVKLHPLEYKQKVGFLSQQMFLQHRGSIDPDHLRSYEVHMDHIFSVKSAIDSRVPLWAVSHPANLQMLPRSENSRKHNTGDPLNDSVKELKKRIKAFNKRHGDPFEKYREEAS